MRVIGLFRVSTDRQEERGTSLETQAERYEQFVRQGGHESLGTFRGSESATQAIKDRHVLQQVLAFIRVHPVEALWVVEQSRLSRGDELETALLMRELRERGTRIIVNGSVRDPSSIDDQLVLGVQSLMDRTEALRIKQRMMSGKRRRALDGKKNCGAAPFGYRSPPPGDPQRGTLQVVPEEAAVVRRIYDLRARGTGTRAIAQQLNTSGIPAPEGGRWGKSTVERILLNPAYAGDMTAGAWTAEKGSRTFRYRPDDPRVIVRENTHEPVVARDLWNAVQAVPKAPRTAHPRMLTELLFVNGYRYGGDKTRTGAFYRGPRGRTGLPWLDAGAVDAAVWYHFTTLARSEDFVRGLMQAHGPGERRVVEQEIEFVTERLGKARRRLDRLVEMRMNDDVPKEDFDRKSRVERDAIAALEKDLAAQHARLASMSGNHAARIVKAVQSLLYGERKLTAQQRRQVIRSIVRRVDVTAEPTSAAQRRDEKGRTLQGPVARWRIAQVAFRLALAPEADPGAGTQTGPTSGESPATHAGDGASGQARVGQLATGF